MTYISLPALPFELWESIASHLSNADIKSLRLACSQFNNAALLRLDRVFLSANPLNIEVFRGIASHDKFRHKVTEIIWDEARLPRGPQRTGQTDEGHELLSDEEEPGNTREWARRYGSVYQEEIIERHQSEEEDGCPRWFKDACEENLDHLRRRRDRDVDRPDHVARREQVFAQPPLRERWQYYQRLLRQQKDVLVDNSDLHAFLYGIKQFPALKRVTITPAAHGHLFAPLYPTPMIRAFPKGFNYPIPRGWLYPTTTSEPATAYAWNEYPELRERYRGFRTAMRVLANEPNSISELIMTSNHLPTGINCTIFDKPCKEYDNFTTVLKTPGFRRLDIAMLIGGEAEEDLDQCWRSFLNGRLRRALGEAKDMEDFRLHTTVISNPYGDDDGDGYGTLDRLIPLQSIVPVEKWPNLRHFELSRFLVSQPDIISFLTALPKSIRSVELSMLKFLEDGGDWHGLLEDMRKMIRENTLWGDRDIAARPKIRIGLPLMHREIGRGQWIEKEVHDFIYDEGKNPFFDDMPCDTPYGVGILKDVFEPNFERPNGNWDDMIEMGITKEHMNYDSSAPPQY